MASASNHPQGEVGIQSSRDGSPLTGVCISVWKHGPRGAPGARGGEEVSSRGAVSRLRGKGFCGSSAGFEPRPPHHFPSLPSALAQTCVTSEHTRFFSLPRTLLPHGTPWPPSLAAFGSQLKCFLLWDVFLDPLLRQSHPIPSHCHPVELSSFAFINSYNMITLCVYFNILFNIFFLE